MSYTFSLSSSSHRPYLIQATVVAPLLQRLPAELLQKIFSYLPIKQQYACSLVNRRLVGFSPFSGLQMAYLVALSAFYQKASPLTVVAQRIRKLVLRLLGMNKPRPFLRLSDVAALDLAMCEALLCQLGQKRGSPPFPPYTLNTLLVQASFKDPSFCLLLQRMLFLIPFKASILLSTSYLQQHPQGFSHQKAIERFLTLEGSFVLVRFALPLRSRRELLHQIKEISLHYPQMQLYRRSFRCWSLEVLREALKDPVEIEDADAAVIVHLLQQFNWHWEDLFSSSSLTLRSHPTIALAALKESKNNHDFIGADLQQSLPFHLKALECNHKIIKKMPFALYHNTPEVAHIVLSHNGSYLAGFSEEIRKTKALVLQAVEHDPSGKAFRSCLLQADLQVVQATLSCNPDLYVLVDVDVLRCPTILQQLIQAYGERYDLSLQKLAQHVEMTPRLLQQIITVAQQEEELEQNPSLFFEDRLDTALQCKVDQLSFPSPSEGLITQEFSSDVDSYVTVDDELTLEEECFRLFYARALQRHWISLQSN